jgi:hypothetical protein
MQIGQRVRSKQTGRPGVIQEIIAPPRNGRSLYVLWLPGPDVSLVSPSELELEGESPRKANPERRLGTGSG